MFIKKGIKLRLVVSLLVMMTALCTIAVNWYSSNQALRSTLTDNYLENNHEYAEKVSMNTSQLLNNMQQDINTLAMVLGSTDIGQDDLDTWRKAYSNNFNSLFTTDSYGVIQLMSPQIVEWNTKVQAGVKIESELMKQALLLKKPFISNPYQATSGQIMLIVSAPIFDKEGKYKGVIDGTVYLESESSISKLFSYQNFDNGSSVFVVDSSGRIIYHPDSTRIYESIADHPLVKNVIEGNHGSSQIINSRGVEYFSGYAPVEDTGWGIIAQTPTTVVEEPLHDLIVKVVIQALPLLFIILMIGWSIAFNLVKPLNTLARFSENSINQKKFSIPLSDIKIRSNIYEVKQLCEQVHRHLNLLRKQVQQDGLTELANRRTFDLIIKDWMEHKIPFSLIMLDIDRFKKVNDTYGHLVGDDVIKFVAATVQEFSNKDDVCFRYGGEEFGILVKTNSVEEAFQIAEALRIKLATTPSPIGHPITVSLGIAKYEVDDDHPESIIQRADSALYTSKSNGRNRSTINMKNNNPLLKTN